MAYKLVGFNLQESLNNKINEAAERVGVKRSDFIRDCIVKELERLGIPVTEEDLASSQGARNDIPNRITEAEKRSRKGMRPRGRPRKETSAHSTSVKPVAFVRITDDGELEPLTNSKPARSSRTSAA